ncbi:MAG: hypothetical protein EA400_10405 [Chromatiaceae bacterium]|nr:MAG: hypothetical protein EA400_10405 [Chromatiaceae bacterium]
MSATATVAKPPLDDVMLAMDVVDTLRRRRSLVERELDESGREQDLKERLRRIYSAQGIEVSDAILEAGVNALKEDRFVYQPPPPGLAVQLARLYVQRGRWGRWLLAGLLVLALALGAWQVFVAGPTAALPERFVALHAQVLAATSEPDAIALAGNLLASGNAALAAGRTADARAALIQFQQMRNHLLASYRLEVVNRPGELTGLWRVPDDNLQARNHYIVVEALDAANRPVRVPVTSEETRTTRLVSRWAVRVEEPTFQRIAADKLDDGIIQNNLFGTKPAGTLQTTWHFPTTGAAITDW